MNIEITSHNNKQNRGILDINNCIDECFEIIGMYTEKIKTIQEEHKQRSA